MYDDTTNPTYVTVLTEGDSPTTQPEVLRVRQQNNELLWSAEFEATDALAHRLRLTDDLDEICATFPSDTTLTSSVDASLGLRLPNDPIFPTLIAFICSSQMQVPRIHAMQQALAQRFGSHLEFDGTEYYAFPTPTQLAEATEEELRELKLGYRARYVVETAQTITTEEIDLSQVETLPYADAHSFLKQFVGVGDKVADCVALYAGGHLEAVPIDTWIEKVIADEYPSLASSSYQETAAAAQDYFGEYAGYAQAYLFASARQGL